MIGRTPSRNMEHIQTPNGWLNLKRNPPSKKAVAWRLHPQLEPLPRTARLLLFDGSKTVPRAGPWVHGPNNVQSKDQIGRRWSKPKAPRILHRMERNLKIADQRVLIETVCRKGPDVYSEAGGMLAWSPWPTSKSRGLPFRGPKNWVVSFWPFGFLSNSQEGYPQKADIPKWISQVRARGIGPSRSIGG